MVFKTGVQIDMLNIPLPMFCGKRNAFPREKDWKYYPEKIGDRKAVLYLGNIIRMQEEIGQWVVQASALCTPPFLQEAAGVLKKGRTVGALSRASTRIGDTWRNFAFNAGRVCKSRSVNNVSYAELSEMLMQCAAEEEVLFRETVESKIIMTIRKSCTKH